MKCFLALLALVCFCDARPSSRTFNAPRATLFENVDSQIIGGANANPGAWPWQLSQQRLGGAWGHSCGASLLSSRYALSAAHCVDGAAVSSIRVIAGLHARSNMANTQTAYLSGYKMHEQYNNNAATYANDIAILNLSDNINIVGNVQTAPLPPNNNNNFAGGVCIITGWGRTSSTNDLPDVLQEATVTALTTGDCAGRVGGGIWDNHLCIFDNANQRGACNGDSGGPANCQGGANYQVAGIASFVFQSGGNCLPSYPSVYTRVSTYLGWIASNTP